jgi:transcriptional regulator with XRE-family HTH domain
MSLQAGTPIYRLEKPSYAGQELRAARTKLELTAKQAATTVGLTQAQLSRVEAGQEYFTESVRARLQKWANIAGVTLNFVVDDWRSMERASRRAPAPKRHGDDSARYYQALAWAKEQGWLTGDQVVTLLLKVAP